MNKLLRYIFFLLIVSGAGYKVQAQVPVYRRPIPAWRYNQRLANQNPQKRIETVKINYLRNRLNLAPYQAQRFFPLYNEYQQELFNVRQLKRMNNMTGTDGPDQINKELAYDNEIVQIRIKFNNAFLKVLSPQQVSELYKAEREFNDELVRQLAERRGIVQPNGPSAGPPPVPQNTP